MTNKQEWKDKFTATQNRLIRACSQAAWGDNHENIDNILKEQENLIEQEIIAAEKRAYEKGYAKGELMMQYLDNEQKPFDESAIREDERKRACIAVMSLKEPSNVWKLLACKAIRIPPNKTNK